MHASLRVCPGARVAYHGICPVMWSVHCAIRHLSSAPATPLPAEPPTLCQRIAGASRRLVAAVATGESVEATTIEMLAHREEVRGELTESYDLMKRLLELRSGPDVQSAITGAQLQPRSTRKSAPKHSPAGSQASMGASGSHRQLRRRIRGGPSGPAVPAPGDA